MLEFIRQSDVVLQELSSARSWAQAFDGDGCGAAGGLQEQVRDCIRDSTDIEGPVIIAPGEPSRVEPWMAYPRNSRPPWHYTLPTRRSMLGRVLPLADRPAVLALPAASLPAIRDDVEPLPRRRRVLPATFV